MSAPRLPTTVPELLDWAAHHHAERVAYRHDEANPPPPMTFGELARLVRQRTEELPPGDGPVTLFLDSSVEWSINFLAIAAQARPAVLIDAKLEIAAVANQLRDARPQVVITDAPRAQLLRAAWAHAANGLELPRLLSIDDRRAWPGGGRARPARPDDVAALLYTSGSTGTPKGIQQTHRGVVASALRVAEVAPLSSADTILSLVPFSHILGFCGVLLSPLYAGASVVFLESMKPPRIMAALREHAVTTLFAPPVLYEVIARKIGDKLQSLPWARATAARVLLALSRALRRISTPLAARAARLMFASVYRELGPQLDKLVTGGARLRPDVAQMLLQLGFDLRQAYGLSEAAGVCVCPRFGGRAGSVGGPMKGMQVRIHEPNPSGDGEIWVRGDQLMRGYYGRPDLTAAVFREGWFTTGDVGHLDARGQLTISGRLNDIIVTSNGKKVFPEDLEAHFTGTPGIGELCVFGLPTPQGMLIALAATPSAQGPVAEANLEGLRRSLEERNTELPPHRRVQRFFVRTAELPKTTTRKIQRHRLVAELTAATPLPLPPQEKAHEQPHDHRV